MISNAKGQLLFLLITGVYAEDVDPAGCLKYDEIQPRFYVISTDDQMQGEAAGSFPSPSELAKQTTFSKKGVQLCLAVFFIALGALTFPFGNWMVETFWMCFCFAYCFVDLTMTYARHFIEFVVKDCFVGILSCCCDTSELEQAIDDKKDDSPVTFWRAIITLNVSVAHANIVSTIMVWTVKCPEECKVCDEGKEFYEICTLAMAHYLLFEKYQECKEERESPEEGDSPRTGAMKALQLMKKIYEGTDLILTIYAFVMFWAGILSIPVVKEFPKWLGTWAVIISGLDALVDILAAFLAYKVAAGRQQEPDKEVPYAVME